MKNKLFRLIANGLNRNSNELDARVNKLIKSKVIFQMPTDIISNRDDWNYTFAFDDQKYQSRRTARTALTGFGAHVPKNVPKFRKICLVTGRTRAVLSYFKLSRIQIKRAAKLRLVTGLRISSW